MSSNALMFGRRVDLRQYYLSEPSDEHFAAASTLLDLRDSSPPDWILPPPRFRGPCQLPESEMKIAAMALMYASKQDALFSVKMDAFRDHIEEEYKKKSIGQDQDETTNEEPDRICECELHEQKKAAKPKRKRKTSSSSASEQTPESSKPPKKLRIVCKANGQRAKGAKSPDTQSSEQSEPPSSTDPSSIDSTSPTSTQSKSNGKTKGERIPAPAEVFGHNLKRFLNSLSFAADIHKASDFAPYEKIVAVHYPTLTPEPPRSAWDNDGGFSKSRKDPEQGHGNESENTLKGYEKAACHRLKITFDQYRTTKARLLIGLACFIEYNSRGLDKNVEKPNHQLPVSPNPKRSKHQLPDTSVPAKPAAFRPVGFKVTQGQQVSKLDGNVTGPLTKIFHAWGWAGEELITSVVDDKSGETRFEVLDKWERRFPKAFREKIFDSLIEWEDSAESGLEPSSKMAFRK